jgi:hypothetical protein
VLPPWSPRRGDPGYRVVSGNGGRLQSPARLGLTLGTVRRAGVEGTGTFGAGLSRYPPARHVEVYEANRPDRSARRLLGKPDPCDAQAAARAVLSGHARARARSGDGPVRSARMFKLAKDSAVLCEVSPVEYSSGRPSAPTQSWRRPAGRRNCAPQGLHPAAPRPAPPGVLRTPHQEGRTRREIVRCFDRHAAREVSNLVIPLRRERRRPGPDPGSLTGHHLAQVVETVRGRPGQSKMSA